MVSGVEIGYNTGASAMQMAETIFGDGVIRESKENWNGSVFAKGVAADFRVERMSVTNG